MSQEKQAFIDPQTGEAIENTRLAQVVSRLAFGLLGGLIGGLTFGAFGRGVGGALAALLFGLFGALIMGAAASISTDDRNLLLASPADWRHRFVGVLGAGLVGGLTFSAFAGPMGGVLGGAFIGLLGGLMVGLPETIRQSVSRHQHFRRQRRLKRRLLEEEWAGVPERALSRACRSSLPQPTDTSLTLTGKLDQRQPHLEEGIAEAQERGGEKSLTGGLGVLAIILSGFTAAWGQLAVTYQTPPRCLIWLEGEACSDHNWVEGPAWNCWAFEGTTHGGVLDLASWRRPREGAYYARFPFVLSEAGEYVLYYLGRIPGCLASPIEWAIDDGPAAEVVAVDGWNAPGQLAQTGWFKYGVIRLGTFSAERGRHTVTITVRKMSYDWIEHLYSQQIDALGIAPASWPVEPAPPPEPRRRPASWTPEPQPPTRPTHDAPAVSPLVIRSQSLELWISPINAGLRQILWRGKQESIPLALLPRAGAFLKVDFRDASAQDNGRVVQVVRKPNRLILHCRNEGLESVLTFSSTGATDEIRVVANLTNRARTPIWRVQWGISEGLGLRGDAADDTWRVAQDTLSPPQVVGRQRRIGPGRFAFDWVCVTDPGATFYAWWEDRGLLDTEVEFGRSGPPGSNATLAFAKFPRICPGETWSSPTLVLGAYRDGDWHRAGDRFSQWWYRWAQSPRIPAWMTRLGGMTVGFDVHGEKALENNRTLLEATRKGSGITAYHGPGWFADATECWYPLQYHLSPSRLRRLREVTEAMREGGGRTSIYTNPLMLSRATPAYELWGRGLATVANDGGIWFTEHHTHHHPMALPYPNEKWAARYVEILEEAVLLGRPDMLYLDQLGAVPAHLDFAPDLHGHRHYGEWTAGSARFLRTVQERLGARYPELVIYIECPAPALLQFAPLSMYGTTPILRYIFPTYHGLVGPYGAVEPAVALDLARTALLTGEPLLLLDARLEGADEATRSAIRDLIVLKKRIDPWLYRARYRDTVGLTLSGDLRASVFVAVGRLWVPFVRGEAGGEGELSCDPGLLGVRVRGRVRAFLAGGPDRPQPCGAFHSSAGLLQVSLPPVPAGVLEIW